MESEYKYFCNFLLIYPFTKPKMRLDAVILSSLDSDPWQLASICKAAADWLCQSPTCWSEICLYIMCHNSAEMSSG